METSHTRHVAVCATALGALVLFATTLPASVARANISGVEVIPAHPSDTDSVSIRVDGAFGNGCWSVQPAVCGMVAGGTISIRVQAIDSWPTPPVCTAIIVPYADTCRYGRLPAGDYHVVFTENHTSTRDPFPQQQTLDFTVSIATPARRFSWGQLKLIYR